MTPKEALRIVCMSEQQAWLEGVDDKFSEAKEVLVNLISSTEEMQIPEESKHVHLLKLIKENPDLEIIPLVEYEVVAGDEYSYWFGKWGSCEITEIYFGHEGVHFKNDDEENVLADLAGCEYGCDQYGRDIYDLSDEEWNKLYSEIPWQKVIAVYITT